MTSFRITMLSRNIPVPDPVVEAGETTAHVLFGSFFRFLIALGIVLLVLGAVVVEGVIAGHFGIYGATAILLGVVGRLIIHWKVRGT